MAARVPRVAVEAVVAALLIGCGCFMLLDLSGKQAVTAMGGAKFSAKLAGKFMQLATEPKAILPIPCTGAETTISATLPGVCNLAAGKTGCCDANKLNARLLPDISNCTTRCQSYYIAFFCYQSCRSTTFTPIATATGSICTPVLQTLFNACNTPTCKILNPGTVTGGDVDFTNFLSTNSIKTDTAGTCLDFTTWGRRCEETAAPTIRTLNVFKDNNDADVTNDRDAVTTISDGATFNFKALATGSTVDNTFGAVIRVCADIVNPRPTDCTTQPSGLSSFPLYANIVVEAQGAVAYTVVNAFVSSQDMVQIDGTGGQPAFYRACVNDIRILPLNREAYTLAISASAVNTFGTGTSAGLSATATPPNQLTVRVELPATPTVINGPYTLNADVQVCATSASTTSIIVGSSSFFVPLNENQVAPGITNYPDSFTVNTINCCEKASVAPLGTPGDNINNGLRQECTINGIGTSKPLVAQNFNAVGVNGQTTIRLVQLAITNTFTALGSITLVNAAITIRAPTGTFLVSGPTALRGGTATALNILADASLAVTAGPTNFLITLGSIEVKTGQNSQIRLNDETRLVVAETSRLIADSSQFTINTKARLVQYTSAPGGITIFAKTAATSIAGTPDAAGFPINGVVAVSGTYVSYNDPIAAKGVGYTPETRISLSRGPLAKDPVDLTTPTGRGDGNAVPEDSEVPLELPMTVPTFQQSTGKKFQELVATPANTRATLQLCGTQHNTVTIPSQGTLLVSPPTGYTGARCQVTGSPANSLQVATLNVAAGGTVSVTGVDGGFLPIRVTNGFNVAQAANIVITLAAGISTSAIPNLPIFDVTGTAAVNPNLCSLLANIEIINQGNRVVTPSCTANTISLAFTAVQATPPPQFNAGLFTSALEYCLLLRQSAGSFDRSAFLQAIDSNFGPDTTRAVVAITTFGTDSDNSDNIRVRFRCYDYSSVSNADTRCSNIVNVATNAGAFRTAILAVGNCGVTTVNANDNDDSNHGLYGLFGLIAIPLICILVIFLVIRNSRRRADNQYMQDAATFSNVASGPQPLATAVPAVQYDVAKEVYPAPAYPAYPAY